MSPNPVTAEICEKLVFFTWFSGLWFQLARRTVLDISEYNKSANRRQSFQKNWLIRNLEDNMNQR